MELNSKQRGVATIELLIAFAILVLALTGVIIVVFGNQSITLDAELNNLALYKAEEQMELVFASAKEGFDHIVENNETDGIFTLDTSIEDFGCFKIATSSAVWQLNTGSQQDVSLTSIFASPEEFKARAGNCFTRLTDDDWDNPSGFADEALGGHGATEVDIFEEFVYLAANKFPPLPNTDLYVMEFDPEAAGINDRLVDRDEINIDEGINDLYVADVAGGRYAFVATASTTAQLQVIDVTDPFNIGRVDNASRGLPGVDPSGSYPEGFSIYYYDGNVYIGTKETSGPEFHRFDVSDPTNPSHEDSRELFHNVNDIYVDGDWAYLATSDNSHELMVINVDSSHTDYMKHPDDTGYGFNIEPDPSFDGDDGTNDATAVFISGDTLFLGREQEGAHGSKKARDFFTLDVNAVVDGASDTDGFLAGVDLGIQKDAFATGITTLGRFVFIGLDDSNIGLQIFNISDPSNPQPPSNCASFNYPENASGIDAWVYDVSGDDVGYVFTSNLSNDEIRVIHDLTTTCPL